MKNLFISMAFMAGSLFLASCAPEFEDGKSDIDSWEMQTDKMEFNHPCLLHTEADFERVRQKVQSEQQPWLMGWKKLLDSKLVRKDRTPSPKEEIIRGGEAGFTNQSYIANDGAAAYQLALAWKISGDEGYAKACINILNQWATVNKSIGGKEAVLVAGFCGYQYANAAEIMRTYEGWSEEELEAVKSWLLKVVYPVCYDWLAANNNLWQSWDLPAMSSMMAIGILCDNSEKVQLVIDYLKEGAGPGCINKAVIAMHEDPAGKVAGKHLAQTQEMGRDQGHSTLNPPQYGYICQMAWNIGIDLFGYSDNLVLDVCEYIAKYNVNPTESFEMPFTPHIVTKDGIKDENGNYWFYEISQNDKNFMVTNTRGRQRAGWELIYNHYVKIKHVKAPYSQEFAEKIRPEGGGRNDGGGESDDMGFGTLMYTLD